MVDIAKREPAQECAADQKGDRAKVVEDYGLALVAAARQVGISIVWTYCAFLSHNDFVWPSSVRHLYMEQTL